MFKEVGEGNVKVRGYLIIGCGRVYLWTLIQPASWWHLVFGWPGEGGGGCLSALTRWQSGFSNLGGFQISFLIFLIFLMCLCREIIFFRMDNT